MTHVQVTSQNWLLLRSDIIFKFPHLFLPFILGKSIKHMLCRQSGLTLFYSWQEYTFSVIFYKARHGIKFSVAFLFQFCLSR